ncbi:MAG: DUF4129 domain-containing protein [Chloroflexi bacterium]|nr:DUF4129 domain-containing protein [Chloroflexota bacterium]
MNRFKRVQALVYLGLSLIGLLILALSVSQLKFLPGVPFSLGNPPPAIAGNNGEITSGIDLVAIIRGFFSGMIVLLVVYLVIHLLSSEGRKRLFADLLALAILFGILLLISPNNRPPLATTPTPLETQPPPQVLTAIPVSSFVANPPPWVDLVAIVLLAILITFLIILLSQKIQRQRQAPTVLDRIAQQAEIALHSLQEGADTENAVLHCYYAMENVVREERNIERDQAMTPQEFEINLIEQGLPGDPVRQLTHLFEQVRYGAKLLGKAEELMAVDSLSAIADACRNPGAGSLENTQPALKSRESRIKDGVG